MLENGGESTMERSITINRPVEEVFAFVTDVANFAKWNKQAGQSEQSSEGPVGLGTKYRGSYDFMGRTMQWVSEITEFEPNQKAVQTIRMGPTEMIMGWFLQPVAGGTKFTIRTEGPTGGLAKLAGPLMDRTMEKDAEDDLARLKALLEG
jgi:uncharacterized protein YndB with AHSA1/START domain